MVLLVFLKRFSTSSTTEWKTQLKLSQLSTQISTILLQRHNWPTHLQTLKQNLPNSTLTPQTFLKILNQTKTSPKTTLDFFHYSKTHLNFQPDLISHCHVIELATSINQAETLLTPLLKTHSVTLLVDSMIKWFESDVALTVSLSLVLECCSYENKLEVFSLMRRFSLLPSVNGFNCLLGSLVKEKEFGLGSCLFSVMLRNGVVFNELTLELVCKCLCEMGKCESVVKLNVGGSGKVYSKLVECYSRKGEFDKVFNVMREMEGKEMEVSFGVYGCVLDDACRLGDMKSVDIVLSLMNERKFVTSSVSNDEVIERLCDMGKTFAAEKLFRGGGRLRDSTYGCMLKALSREGRVKESVEVYRLICRRGVTLFDESCYKEFADGLCRGYGSLDEEEEVVLVDVIKRGFVPCTEKVSEVLASLCGKKRWKEAEKLLDSVMEMEVCFDSFSCGLLMERYCRTGKVERAMELHEKIKKMKGSLDVNAYNAVLDRLMVRGSSMVDEAVGVFEYMKEMNVVSSKSFTIMIHGLYHAKEMKKAMKCHDEMLRVGMKPDLATYKRLILCFK